jgi:hypothetical protein
MEMVVSLTVSRYLEDNLLTSLPELLFSNSPQLENVYVIIESMSSFVVILMLLDRPCHLFLVI